MEIGLGQRIIRIQIDLNGLLRRMTP